MCNKTINLRMGESALRSHMWEATSGEHQVRWKHCWASNFEVIFYKEKDLNRRSDEHFHGKLLILEGLMKIP